MSFFRSYVNSYVISQHEDGGLEVENPDVTCEYLENGRVIYCSQANLVFPTNEILIGVGSLRAEAIRNMNVILNKKISAKDRTNFLENNCFFLIS